MTGLQGIVDAGANVVHASSRGDVDGERKQALDEALLDNGLFGELGFLIEQGDDDLGQIGGVVARANLVEVLWDMVLVDVARELFCLGRKSGKRPKMSKRLYLRAFCKARKFHF